MQVIAHNLLSQFTDRQLNITTKEKGKTAEKLSSGYKINRSADDAAGLNISEKMRYQIRGLNRGGKNTQEGISWLQVADGAMEEITSIIHRMRELAVQASNDTNTAQDREALNQEISELRKEINKICLDTEFNTKDVFDNSYVTMDVDGMPGDLQVFDATYDLPTGDVSYGGFVFHGERYTWDTVAPGMVYTDATGKQAFNGGEYTFTDAAGRKFDITCEPGAEVPTITRKIDLSADASGITIDGQLIDWSKLVDENWQPFSATNMHSGAWSLDYQGASIGFFVGSDITQISDMADAINSCNDGKVTYSWETKFSGTQNEKAVDASVMKQLQVSNSLAQQLATSPTLSYTVRASKDPAHYGIWLEKDGKEVADSFQSWQQLLNAPAGTNLWETGSYIDSDITYTYSDTDGKNDTRLSFTFTLSDITSINSVIDGLNQMVISGKDIKNNYGTSLNITQDKNLLKASMSSRGNITFQDELALQRDFDVKEDQVANSSLTYDKATGKTQLVFDSKISGTPAVTYEGSTANMERLLDSDLQTYLNFVLRRKVETALSGGNAQDPNLQLSSGSLTDLVNGNITVSGYFDSTVTINAARMNLTDGKGWALPGEDGKTYPTAYIDFANIGGGGSMHSLDELVGLGFNSTCKTCNNHYSIMFVNGAQGDATPSGYNYNFRQQGQNYTLQIDIDSLKNNGVGNGADLSKAIVEITSECFDFHYTQYAADGSRLYIYDNREQNVGTRDATFDTAPFMAVDTGIYSTTVSTNDGKSISFEYTFNYGDIKDNVIVNMQQDDANGNYVKLPDGSYEVYDPMNLSHQGITERYRLDISYQDRQGNALTDQNGVLSNYKEFAMNRMLGGSDVELHANDYTYMKIEGDENRNVAVRPIFESELVETPYENGMHIQNSSQNGDSVLIPRFALNSVVLRLYRADVSTYENAQKTLGYADRALEVVSEKRSMYGAYKNRLDHTYAANMNTMENSQAAESRLRDADMADEIVKHSKHSILEQTGQAMLAQANQTPQEILRLFQ